MTTYAIEIEWSEPAMPSLVGPFDTREDASRWAESKIKNGAWLVTPLTSPYFQEER